eukprot:scaffold22819_cov28-Tisochrysis_lutea.AAC.5
MARSNNRIAWGLRTFLLQESCDMAPGELHRRDCAAPLRGRSNEGSTCAPHMLSTCRVCAQEAMVRVQRLGGIRAADWPRQRQLQCKMHLHIELSHGGIRAVRLENAAHGHQPSRPRLTDVAVSRTVCEHLIAHLCEAKAGLRWGGR